MINQHVIVLAVIPNLFGRVSEAALNDFFRILRSHPQSLFEDIARRRQNEDADSLRNPLLQLSRTLDVNVEYQVFAFTPRLVQHFAVRAVVIPKHLSVLQKFATSDTLFEFLRRDINIALPRLLISANGSRGVGNGKPQLRIPRQKQETSVDLPDPEGAEMMKTVVMRSPECRPATSIGWSRPAIQDSEPVPVSFRC